MLIRLLKFVDIVNEELSKSKKTQLIKVVNEATKKAEITMMKKKEKLAIQTYDEFDEDVK